MFHDDIFYIIFQQISSLQDAVNLALTCKDTNRLWRFHFATQHLRRLLPPIVQNKRGNLEMMFCNESDTKVFISYIASHIIDDCIEAMGLQTHLQSRKSLCIRLILKDLCNHEKKQAYETIVAKSGIIRRLRNFYDMVVIDIVYAKGHMVSWTLGNSL